MHAGRSPIGGGMLRELAQNRVLLLEEQKRTKRGDLSNHLCGALLCGGCVYANCNIINSSRNTGTPVCPGYVE